tara:strand:+ start:142 stop:432 length:291 start_codon:yes stop_codon:yes gene_type:complete
VSSCRKNTKKRKTEKKMAQQDIKNEMDEVINQLEKKGVRYNQGDEITGLGDVVESVLTSMGITQERFKEWFNLKECNCSKRKQWLNNLFSWKKSKE